MFGGQWKESSENSVTLEIPDPNIDTEGAYQNLLRELCEHIKMHTTGLG